MRIEKYSGFTSIVKMSRRFIPGRFDNRDKAEDAEAVSPDS